MIDQLPALVLLLPFFCALLATLAGLLRRSLCLPITVIGLAGSLAAAIAVAMQVADQGSIQYKLGGWQPPMGIVFQVDMLNALVLVVIGVISLFAAISSSAEIRERFPTRTGGYYALFLLFVTGLLGITLTGDAFNLYVMIEVCSLTSYALIAQGGKRAVHASFNYLIIGMVGACLYLLGVGYLLIKTGTLNMLDIHTQIAALGLEQSTSIHVAFVLIMVGLLIKMAQFPLHGWLPNAYTYCPQATANLIAPLMTKVMVYVMARMMLDVFGLEYIQHLPWHEWMVVLASVGIVTGSLLALGQQNLRRMLCYIIVAEVGYMVGGLWLMNEVSMTGALYHIVADAAMTACLFITVGLIIRKTGKCDRSAFEGLFAKMPLTMSIFVLGGFSIMGLPPTAGFFSKWYLIGGGIQAGNWLYVISLLISSLCSAVIFFRLIEIALFGQEPADGHAHGHTRHEAEHAPMGEHPEAPTHLLLPAFLLGVSILLIGILNTDLLALLSETLQANAAILP